MIISTIVVKRNGLIYGNIAAAAVVKAEPGYGPDPGMPGFGTLVASIEDGAAVFPPPTAVAATQNQPPTVLPGQPFNVTLDVSNTGTTAASSVAATENFDGMSPASGSNTIGSITAGDHRTVSFAETIPVLPLRQASESSVDYQARLTATDGRLFTAAGSVTFTDAAGQPYVPLDVSSSSRVQLPVLTVALTGTPCVAPGTKIPYVVTVTNLGSAPAATATAVVVFPDGSAANIPPISNLAPGTSFKATVNFNLPPLAPQGASESTPQYLARLAASDGKILTASVKLNWTDVQGNNYGEVSQDFPSITERVPILSVTPQLPLSAIPGQTAVLNLTVQNSGGGNAAQANLKVVYPDGTSTILPGFPLGAGQANTQQVSFKVPVIPPPSTLANLTATDNSALNFGIQLGWTDARTTPTAPPPAARRPRRCCPSCRWGCADTIAAFFLCWC